MSEKKSFEESLKTLESIVSSLEKDDISLEDSIRKYKKGVQLVKDCNNTIDQIEKELQVITEDEAE